MNTHYLDLVRMLNLLPYFQKHPGRSIMEAAADLGTDPGTLKKDLNRLYCCGPGITPDQLVDLRSEFHSVKILDSQGMDFPLRLNRTEANALILGLESLLSAPGLVEKEAVESAIEKIRSLLLATGLQVNSSDHLGREQTRDEHGEKLALIATSLQKSQRIAFSYYSRAKDALSKRYASPVRLFSKDGVVYLHAYDHDAVDHRTFRIDCITDLTLENESAESHLEELEFDSNDPFDFHAVTEHATIVIYPHASWLADTIPHSQALLDEDHHLWITLPLVSRTWLVNFALGNTDRMRVVEPAEIADTVRKRARELKGAYD
ncbi:YafY family protein [Corynebacterium sp. ES2775-CONJ]|uniref:helix-turn-helix transcriptional regulator n=1 Tax=Corynebacterium sp. ES2775-CONJ TaxID=2974029 RepID=UPI002169A9B3|nr:WYL domain-containing protein [Corynebacterium sp. ES2775-CONJ]MCS4489345.1 WYL domain-containing protein [Corynebacterium sp. ES2775-CONJ]